MSKRIAVILGHPAKDRVSFCEALASAYATGARNAGHDVHVIKLSDMAFDPILHEGFHGIQDLESDIRKAQEIMMSASHWVFVYPLWQFMIPALLKGFLERVLVDKFAFDVYDNQAYAKRRMLGKSARIVQTMGISTPFYWFFLQEHGTKALKAILEFMGLDSIKITLFGQVENPNDGRRQSYLERMRRLGVRGE